MTFSYAIAAPAATDKVRLLIGDTSAASYVFEDEELTTVLALLGGDVHLAAAQCLRTLAADKAKQAVYYQVQGFSMDRRQAPALLLDAAERLEAAARQVPFEYESVTEFFVDVAGRDVSNYVDTEEAT